MKKFLFMFILLLPMVCHAQCNEETKKQVDSLKASISYPKFNIGDILYIAFINNPNVDIKNVTEKDIDVKKVRIYNMRPCNSMVGSNFIYVFSLNGASIIEWRYQFIDLSIKNPKYKDFSDFYIESRFSTTSLGAKRALIVD